MNRNPKNYGSITIPEVGFSGSSRGNEISTEFNSLCDDIATNLHTIHSSIKTLQENLRFIGTAKDNTFVRNKIHITQLSANQVASATIKEFGTLRHKIPKNDKQKQLRVDKLEGDFKETLNKYYTLQKELVDKQKANLLLIANSENAPSDDEEGVTQQKQMQLARELQFEQEMMIEREERVKQIEADVLDINQIMRELASQIHAQGEVVDSIESNIDHAAGNVEEGAEQLLKASRYQSSYRKKLLILVIVVAIIVTILIAVLVTELKK